VCWGDYDSFVCWGDRSRVLMALMEDGRSPSQIPQSDVYDGLRLRHLPTKSEQDSLSAAMGKGAVGTMQKVK